MNDQELRRLIDSLMDGDISEADFLRLEAELSVDAEARKEYYDRVALVMLLKNEAEATANTIEGPNAKGPKDKSHLSRWIVPLVATVASLAALVGWWMWSPKQDANSTVAERESVKIDEEEQAVGFAVITGQADAVWTNGSRRTNGALLPTGNLHLLSGVLQLELFSGVSVVVEGEAEFAVKSSMEMSVQRGKVRAHVPEPAHGFRIATRDGEIVDLGTEFAVHVTPNRSEVHVLDGEVKLERRGEELRRVERGQAVRLSTGAIESELTAKTSEFLGAEELRNQLQNAQQTKRQQWLQHSEQLRRDPRVVAMYQFGQGNRWERRIPNQATGESSVSGEGAVVAAVRTTDRWQHTDGALDFSPTGSRVRLAIPGEFGSLTLMCWVRINSLDRWYNSLFLTDGHDQHEPHWQIMDDGRLFFSVKKRDQWDASKGEKDKHIYYSPPFWNATLSGQWLMIATVHDVQNRQVTHFANGEILSQERIPDEYLVESVRIGNASLCNWGQPERDEPRFAVRNLNGSLDEFIMFDVALTPAEIKELYINGQP